MAGDQPKPKKGRLLPPEWTDTEKLEKMKDHEGKEETFPPDLALTPGELRKLLLNKVSDNIPKADEIWTLASQAPGVCRQLSEATGDTRRAG